MFRVSDFIVGLLNCASLLLGLVAIAVSLFFHLHGGSQCEKVLQNPLLITGSILFLVSLLGLFGSFCRLNALLFLYVIVMLCSIVELLWFTVFTFMVTNDGVGKMISDKRVGEMRTSDFAHWLENNFVNGKKWDDIRSCLRESEICRISKLYERNLSPIQSTCCKPPSECGFQWKGATRWEAPKGGKATNNSDCHRWSNEQDKLCYDCNACKEGFLMTIKKQWRYGTIFNLCALILLIISYSFGCFAMKNNEKDNRIFRNYHP